MLRRWTQQWTTKSFPGVQQFARIPVYGNKRAYDSCQMAATQQDTRSRRIPSSAAGSFAQYKVYSSLGQHTQGSSPVAVSAAPQVNFLLNSLICFGPSLCLSCSTTVVSILYFLVSLCMLACTMSAARLFGKRASRHIFKSVVHG